MDAAPEGDRAERSPRVRLAEPEQPELAGWPRAIDAAAAALDLVAVPANITQSAQIEPAIASFASAAGGALLVLPDPFLAPHRELVYSLAARHRLPAVYGGSGFDNGRGLVYYGGDTADLARNAASYVDRIFKGEAPGNLPVQSPKQFRLIVNVAVAKSLALAVPSSMLLRADRIVE